MTYFDFCTENEYCDSTKTDVFSCNYITNPIEELNEEKAASWLDDLGWI